MHPSLTGLMKSFSYDHLPEGKVRDTSQLFAKLADTMVNSLPSSADLTYGLRKLWEAKNAFVYAAAAEQKEIAGS